MVRLLDRRGLADRDESGGTADAWAEEAPALAGIAAASVQGLVAIGPRAGARVRRCGDPPQEVEEPALGRSQARQHGFDLHAGIVAPAGHLDRLERLCRYALRPPVAQDRLRLTGEGQVLLQLRHRWTDGTTHLRFDPIELLERLAALTPRPRINLMRLIALIEQATVIQRILRHLRLPTEIPEPRPARAPPIPLDAPDLLGDHDVTAFDACS